MHRCPRADDQMTAYNVLLTQDLPPGPETFTVARFCTEHFHWHIHIHRFKDRRKKTTQRQPFYRIDSSEAMLKTYRFSLREFRRHGRRWVAEWTNTQSSTNAFGFPRF